MHATASVSGAAVVARRAAPAAPAVLVVPAVRAVPAAPAASATPVALVAPVAPVARVAPVAPVAPVTPVALVALLALAALAGCSREAAPDATLRRNDGNAARGRQLVAQYQCGSCHALAGAPSPALTAAPPLDGFGRRSYIGGRLANTPQTLQRWLQSPHALVADATMPDLGVSAADARDIAAWLLATP